MQLGEQIATLREERVLTQAELAEMARISPSTLSLIESGKVPRPHVGTIRKISRALGVEPLELRSVTESTSPKVGAPPSLADWLQERCGHALLTLADQELEGRLDAAHDAEVPNQAAKRLFGQVTDEYLTILKPGDVSDEERLLLNRRVKREAARKWSLAFAESGELVGADERFQQSVRDVLEAMAG
jgi:transcriptional regulator with XRE-family HTH domain